ncbi:MAG TPA: hypothetical protein VFK15_00810 [Burkholderiales bacterium]|jgi:hypothetical protein|nr:hypothetical protein [Burkholderiales bacterium]
MGNDLKYVTHNAIGADLEPASEVVAGSVDAKLSPKRDRTDVRTFLAALFSALMLLATSVIGAALLFGALALLIAEPVS